MATCTEGDHDITKDEGPAVSSNRALQYPAGLSEGSVDGGGLREAPRPSKSP